MISIKKIINKINTINTKLSEEFPNLTLKYANSINNKIKMCLFYNQNKISNITNNFEMLDGGIKDRIIRKTKYLLNNQKIIFSNKKHNFILSI